MSGDHNSKLEKYREIASRGALESRHDDVRSFFDRMEREEVPIFEDFHSGIGSFYQAPRRQDLEEIDIACVGVPLEASAPVRAGARLGPKSIRDWSKLRGPVHESWNIIPFELCSVADFGEFFFSSPHNVPTCVEELTAQYAQFRENKIIPLSFGGVHTMSHPILKGLAGDEPLALIHIDAHADTYREAYQGDQYSDAAVFLNAALEGAIDPERVVQIGIRGRSVVFWDFSHESGMRVIPMDEFFDIGVKGVLEEIKRVIGTDRCYLTLDADGIDSTYLPGTQLPEPFGLTSREVLQIIRGLRGMNLVGADFVELCPPYDPHDISANLGAALGFEMLCLLAESHVAQYGQKRKTTWD